MGVPVPEMVYTTARRLSAEDVQQIRNRFSNAENFQGMPILEGRLRPARHHGPCTQCGAPDETGAHVCAYCLTPKADAGPVEMIEVTTLEDAEPRYLPRYAVEPFAPPRK